MLLLFTVRCLLSSLQAYSQLTFVKLGTRNLSEILSDRETIGEQMHHNLVRSLPSLSLI